MRHGIDNHLFSSFVGRTEAILASKDPPIAIAARNTVSMGSLYRTTIQSGKGLRYNRQYRLCLNRLGVANVELPTMSTQSSAELAAQNLKPFRHPYQREKKGFTTATSTTRSRRG